MKIRDLHEAQQLFLADKGVKDPNPPVRKDSGKAAIIQSTETKASKPRASTRQKYTGVRSQDIYSRTQLVAAQKPLVRSTRADDVRGDEVALQQQKDPFTGTSTYDIRTDLKPRAITYRQVFK